MTSYDVLGHEESIELLPWLVNGSLTASEREAVQAREGTTPNGKRFYRMAVDEERRGDRVRARAHMKMALTFEPENEHFQEKFASLQRTEPAR